MMESKGVHEFSYEKEEDEGVLMDVDAAAATDWTSLQRPASSYDIAAVGTGADISLEQETEDDDRLSTSTIEYHYSEEERYYYYSGSDSEEDASENACEDDDDDDCEEDPIKNVDDDLEVLEVQVNDQQTIFSDPSDVEELPMEEAVPTTDEESTESGSDQTPGEKLSKEDWIASWNKGDPRKHSTWINVYSYYRKKEKGYGGYGVIIRYADAKPVAATAKYSKVGKSFFYQLLLGIKAGVKLAAGHNLSGRYVICNSNEVEMLIKNACRTEKCRISYSEKVICKDCKHYLDCRVGCDMGLWPLIQDLKQEGLDLVKYPRTSNEPAHYLAKMAKAKHDRNVLKGIASDDEDLGEIEPDKFLSKLKDLLWKDFSGGMSIYRAASR